MGCLSSWLWGGGPLTLSQGDRSEGGCVCKKERSQEKAGSERVEAQAFSFSQLSFAGTKPVSLRAVLTLPTAMT